MVQLTRRRLLTGAGTAVAAASLHSAAPGHATTMPPTQQRGLGSGGPLTDLATLAAVAKQVGAGEPVALVVLAAIDQNLTAVLQTARERGWALRPALKSFQSAGLCGYVLRRMPQPRGLVFHLRTVEDILASAPAGTDLMTGYPPTVGELEAWLGRRSRPGLPRHRLRYLVDSVPLLQRLAELAATTPRPLPLEVALEFDSGQGRGGLGDAAELSAALCVLRAARGRLQLTAVMCYDGHATFNSDPRFRQAIAQDAQRRYTAFLEQLAAEGAGLYDPRSLVRNGPGSSNYANWGAGGPCNEISPGSALVFSRNASSYGLPGLAPALTMSAPVMRITSRGPSVPLAQLTPPGAPYDELILKGGGWPTGGGSYPSFVHPEGMEEDELSGGRGNNACAAMAPANSVKLGDHVLVRPFEGGNGLDYFGAVHAVRAGRVLTRWRTFSRWD